MLESENWLLAGPKKNYRHILSKIQNVSLVAEMIFLFSSFCIDCLILVQPEVIIQRIDLNSERKVEPD